MTLITKLKTNFNSCNDVDFDMDTVKVVDLLDGAGKKIDYVYPVNKGEHKISYGCFAKLVLQINICAFNM